jgi:hypothetical protein
MASTLDIVSVTMLALILGGLVGLYIYVGMSSPNADNANEINKHITIIAGTLAGLIIISTALSFYYFTTAEHLKDATAFLLVMNGVNIFLSLFAVSAATIQVFH